MTSPTEVPRPDSSDMPQVIAPTRPPVNPSAVDPAVWEAFLAWRQADGSTKQE